MVLSASEGQRKENLPLRRRTRTKGSISGFTETVEQPEDTSSSQPQHVESVSPTTTSQPCHSARLALLCTQNSVHLGARTRLSLCPPGRNRRSLQATLRSRHRGKSSRSLPTAITDSTNFYSLVHMLGRETMTRSDEQEEDYLLSTNTFDLESDEEASSGDEDDLDSSPVQEPLFVPAGGDGEVSSGKLPFHHRKIRYFDAVSATERRTARTYLQQQMRKSKRRDGILLTRHLRRMQRQEKRRLENGASVGDDDSVDANDDLSNGVSKFDAPMSASLSAALLLESLSMSPIESLEGMAKCYDGIVTAGVALLDMDMEQKKKRGEVLEALRPLLISSLEQPSGEVILELSKLRRLCGTPRYQRRFVQRIAPSLIRPPRGAMWCLRHQHDMEPILAAAELIFDSASQIFSSGWYEKGRQLLADSVRKETLNNAAQQLRDLSQENTGFGLTHGHRRKLMKSGTTKDPAGGSALAEWEVIAVDRQIRISISNILSKDWSKVTVPAKDAELAAKNRHRGTSVSSTERRPRGTTEPSHKASSPRSPNRTKTTKNVSPQGKFHPSHGAPPAPDTMESVFGPSFTSNSDGQDVPMSPPPRRELTAISHDLPITKTPPRSPSSPPNTPSIPASAARETMRSPPPTHSDPMLQPPPIGSAASSSAAPLSPQSSVGNLSVSSADVPYHRSSSNASVASTGSTSSQPAHYRMLTSTAAERKRTVAACRALRSQIQRFEEAFMQLHGRAPKGAAERAPLATTYAQYREWKRAIRADAACRIQALFRGARTRWILLRSNNSRLSRVVMTRAGRGTFGKPETRKSRGATSLNDLSIPIEIGSEPERALGLSPMPSGHPKQSDVGVEVFINNVQSASASASTPPVWSTAVQPRRGSSDRDIFNSPSPTSFAGSPTGASASALGDLSHLSLPDLQARKRDLKQQLKQYDMSFARKHGRMPVKAEKEPIRHLYETYNTLKTRITDIEREPHKKPSAMAPPHQVPLQQTRVLPVQRTPSPPLTSASGGSSGPDSSSSEDQNPGPSMVRPKRSGNKKQPSFSDTPSTPSGQDPSQDLAALKVEKGKLHQMLRSYEKDFFKEHKRQVSSFADIKPVASQYRRYKEIKKAIAAFQQHGEK